jgi:hypothetical protein
LFKKLANLASLMRQAQEVGSKMQAVNDTLRTQRAVGSAGGGLVEVEVNGLGEVLQVNMDRQLLERGEFEMIESLLPAAVNQAVARAKDLHAQAVQSALGDMELPGLDEALSQITQNADTEDDA